MFIQQILNKDLFLSEVLIYLLYVVFFPLLGRTTSCCGMGPILQKKINILFKVNVRTAKLEEVTLCKGITINAS